MIIVRKYIIVPELKGNPIVFTKNNSKVEIKLTAPGIITPCTKPKITIEANQKSDYRINLEKELKELRNSELWKTGSEVRKLRP